MELLNRIQRELKVPKGQFNAFAKYNYRNCEDILEAVKPLLGEKGTLTLNDEMVQLGDRYYVKATAELSDGTIEGSAMPFIRTARATAYAREALDKKGMDEAQITGAASSYARKYALCGLFCIDDGEDADGKDNSQVKPAAKPVPPKQVADKRTVQKARIKELVDNKTLVEMVTGDDYKHYVKENTGLELEAGNYEMIIERLEALQ